MKPEFRKLRREQIERLLKPFLEIKDSPRPQRGWIRAIREARGVTLREMAQRLRKSTPLASYLEKSEADYRITLGNLRDTADALGCRLVYAFVPKGEDVPEVAEAAARTRAAENVRAVEHTMALEGQAVGGIEDKIEEETRRILKRSEKI